MRIVSGVLYPSFLLGILLSTFMIHRIRAVRVTIPSKKDGYSTPEAIRTGTSPHVRHGRMRKPSPVRTIRPYSSPIHGESIIRCTK